MDPAAMVVALGWGALTGWLLGRMLDDLRPVVAALIFGTVSGVVIHIVGGFEGSGLAAGSLLLGCLAGLGGLAPHLANSD